MVGISKAYKPGLNRGIFLFWIGLLCLAQVADLVTTQIDLAQGGVEANVVAAQLMAVGGIGLLTVVKIGLVVAMAVAVIVIDRQGRLQPAGTAAMARTMIWRGVQVCVVALAVTALHNVVVLTQLQS